MKNNLRIIITLGILLIVLQMSYITIQPIRSNTVYPFFTLTAICTGPPITDIYRKMRTQLLEIGIDVNIFVSTSSVFTERLLGSHNFDLVNIAFANFYDPDYSGIYAENGVANFFGYNTSMDWDEELGTGINEWYIKQGSLMMPPNSAERIQHYWNWEQYMMDKICPLLPLYNAIDEIAYWSTLEGYNHSKGLLQSWGNLSWNGTHVGQDNIDEIVISDACWSDLNPLFQEDLNSQFISNAILDPLVWYDPDSSIWPNLAKSIEYLNDTTIEIKAREGIKWNNDPDNNFTNEYFDIRDVFFTLYCWKHLSNNREMWDWIKDIKIKDKETMLIYVDGDNSTPQNVPYSHSLLDLAINILPEHYLNQSQLEDGITPDILHPAWNIYTSNAFGTGLFEISDFTIDVETVLTVNPDCWKLNTTITSDPALDFERRFGDFSNIIHQLRIRIIPDRQTAIIEFEAGKVDIETVTDFPDLEPLYNDTNFCISNSLTDYFTILGFNMRENRGPIGSRELCPNDDSMMIGLAIRKAISYAIDREKINNVIYDGKRRIVNCPISEKLSIWCNPSIIHYDYNLLKAYEMMEKAGYDIPGFYSPGTGISTTLGSELISIGIILIIIISVDVFKNKRKKKC